jgi:type III secretory pathway component EscU
LSEYFFPYFFRVHLNILDTVVSTPFLGHLYIIIIIINLYHNIPLCTYLVSQYATERPKIKYSRNSIIRQVRDRLGDELRKLTNREVQKKITEKHFEVHNVLFLEFLLT